MMGLGSWGGRQEGTGAPRTGPVSITPPSRQISSEWPRWRGQNYCRCTSPQRSNRGNGHIDGAGQRTYVEGSDSWYVQSAPRRRHAAHAGRALSHFVRRKRQVRHAFVARFRGYVVAAREARRFWVEAVPWRRVDGAGTVVLGRRLEALSGARVSADCTESHSASLGCAP